MCRGGDFRPKMIQNHPSIKNKEQEVLGEKRINFTKLGPASNIANVKITKSSKFLLKKQ
jgi:hypothetical protein